MKSDWCSKVVRMINVAVLCVTGLLVLSCVSKDDSATRFQMSMQSVDVDGWDSRDTLAFDLQTDSVDIENIKCKVVVRSTMAFPYKKLNLIATIQSFSKETSLVKSLSSQEKTSYRLTYTLYGKDGRHTGIGFPFYENRVVLPIFKTEPNRSYRLLISHPMRRNLLPGVSEVGLDLYKIKK